MVRNIKLIIEYDGTNYCGWQSQAGHHSSIQETISDALKKITGKKTTLYGASRTDSGVHALEQTANFFTDSRLPAEKFIPALNHQLPPDIVIKQALDVPPDFNARTKARRKTYVYTIMDGPTPSALRRNFIYFAERAKLNLKKMKKAARSLVGRHNFRSFATKGHLKENCIREIYSLNICRKKDTLQFKVAGNAFLYNMVRALVGTLLMVGRGKIQPEEVKKIIDSHDRKNAGPKVPAQGLCLVKIDY
ncbi:MAG: tRNA pseudouridine(38-40) synthase TruA [Planctomycetota bacterium]